jgi:hypothetical protein
MQSGISINPEEIIKHSRVCNDEEKAVYHISTMAHFENGISGEEIQELIEMSEQTGENNYEFIRRAWS